MDAVDNATFWWTIMADSDVEGSDFECLEPLEERKVDNHGEESDLNLDWGEVEQGFQDFSCKHAWLIRHQWVFANRYCYLCFIYKESLVHFLSVFV